MIKKILQMISLAGVLVSSPALATNYFSWGVESPANNAITVGDPCGTGTSGTVSKQFWVNPWFSNTTQDCTVAHSGSCSMRLNVQNNDGGNQQMGPDVCNNVTFPSQNIIGNSGMYYRWWMRINTGFNWGTNERKTKSSRTLMTGGQLYTGYVWGGGFRISECSATGNCNSPGGGANNDYQGIDYDMDIMADNQWHEYIVFVRPSSSVGVADALFRVWIDGVEIQHSPWCSNSSTHCSTGTTGFIWGARQDPWVEGWGGWMARPYFQLGNNPGGAGGIIYIDDVSTDNTWNSTLGGSDTTAPTTPGTPTCTSSSETAVSCSWTASTDAVGVTGYLVERRSLPDGGAYSQIGTPTTNTINDTVSATTRYGYRVRATDAAGNLSSYSSEGTVTVVKNLSFGYGVNLPLEFRDGTWDSTQRTTALNAIENMCGSTCWVRMDVTHSTVEATQGTYDWSIYDIRINELKAKGFKILLMLGYSPVWNRDVSCSTSNSLPTSGAAFGAFVNAAVARFTPDAVEFWNEPNAITFSCPAVDAGVFYTKVQEVGYNASKAARPQTAVITGGTGPATDIGCTGTAPKTCTTSRTAMGWLTDLYSISGAKEHWDAIGHHPYTNNAQPPGTAYTTGLGTGWMQMEQYTGTSLRTAMTNNGQSNLKIVTTEWGIPTSGSGNMGSVSTTLQADSWVTAGFTILASKSWAGPSFWYVLTDRCATAGNEECWFGLLQSDLSTKKRSFGAFKSKANPLAAPTNNHRNP